MALPVKSPKRGIACVDRDSAQEPTGRKTPASKPVHRFLPDPVHHGLLQAGTAAGHPGGDLQTRGKSRESGIRLPVRGPELGGNAVGANGGPGNHRHEFRAVHGVSRGNQSERPSHRSLDARERQPGRLGWRRSDRITSRRAQSRESLGSASPVIGRRVFLGKAAGMANILERREEAADHSSSRANLVSAGERRANTCRRRRGASAARRP
jgi:hypothetical protein